MQGQPTCSYQRCGGPIKAKRTGLCAKHHTRYVRHGDPGVNLWERKRAAPACPSCGGPKERESKQCRACWSKGRPQKWYPCENCGKRARGRRCRDCWKLIARDTNPRAGTRGTCTYPACGRPHSAHGWCYKHALRVRKHGDPSVNLRPPTGATRECPSCGKRRAKVRKNVCRDCWKRALPKWIGCLVEGCPDPHAAKGYCTKHAHRVRRYGDPDIVRLRSVELVAQLPTPSGGCIEWPYLDRAGYGRAVVGNRSMGAHRFVWEEQMGPIPPGLHLDHLCCNRACVNVKHLEPVTPEENQRRRWVRWWARQAA